MRTLFQERISGLKALLIENFDELARYALAWDRLNKLGEFPHAFGRFAFTSAWWQAFSERKLLRILVLSDERFTVRLILPCYSDVSEPDLWRPIGYPSSDYFTPLVNAGDTEAWHALISWIQERRPRWGQLLLGPLPEALKGTPAIVNMSLTSFVRRPKMRAILNRGPFYSVTWTESHPYVERSAWCPARDPLKKRSTRKHINWFMRQGVLRYECLTNAADILMHLDEFTDLHAQRWAKKGQASILSTDKGRAFLRHLLAEFGEDRSIRFDRLSLDQATIAAHLGFQWGDRVYWYLTCFDPQYGPHSPGKVLLAHALSTAEGTTQEFDFLRGRESYKNDHASAIRRTANVAVFRDHYSLFRAFARRWTGPILSRS